MPARPDRPDGGVDVDDQFVFEDLLQGGRIPSAGFWSMEEDESYAVYLLEQEGVKRLDITTYLSHGIGRTGSTGSRLPTPAR